MRSQQSRINLTPAFFLCSGILFLFFFQLLSDFIESIYAFGLLGTSIPPEIAASLLLFIPLVLLILPDRISGRTLVLFGELVLLCRVVEPLLDTRSRMFVAGLGVGIFLIFFPAWLFDLGRKGLASRATLLGAGLALSVSLSILFRSLGSGPDLSTSPSFQWIGWILAVAAAVLLPPAAIASVSPGQNPPAQSGKAIQGRVVTPGKENRKKSTAPFGSRKHQAAMIPPEAGNPLLLTFGIFSVLILIYFAFATPAVIARWTEGNYLIILFLLALGLSVFAAYGGSLATLAPSALAGVNLVFVLSLVGTLFTNAVNFPANPGSFPIPQKPAPDFSAVLLSVALVTAPVLIIDFTRFTRGLIAARPVLRTLGATFSLGALFLLVMIFAHVFTTTYDYIPVVGPFFRDRFWLVYLLPGTVLILVLLRTPVGKVTGIRPAWLYPALVTCIGLLAVAGAAMNLPHPDLAPQKDTLRVLTYNIQQGYREDGQRGYADQLALLRQADPDLIGLQESDTARISGGNTDIVRYFADQLGMYSYYGPRTVTGTFGIALLSKYPLQEAQTFFMYSTGEQTAAIQAQVSAAGQVFNVFVTHLGNGGPIVQQQEVLKEIDSLANVIAMGDFNFDPNTEQYHLTTQSLADAWMVKWPSGIDDQGNNPADRIDHVFLSPGLQVVDARHIQSPASDHPAVIVEVRP